jgi:hypothetical protein
VPRCRHPLAQAHLLALAQGLAQAHPLALAQAHPLARGLAQVHPLARARAHPLARGREQGRENRYDRYAWTLRTSLN